MPERGRLWFALLGYLLVLWPCGEAVGRFLKSANIANKQEGGFEERWQVDRLG